MNRQKLIDALKNVEPARNSLAPSPIMRGFWFTGKRIMAYNGNMALAVAFKTEFTGSVQETLLPLLESSAAAEVEFTIDEKGVLIVKAGTSKFKLQTQPAEDFVFKMPKLGDDEFPFTDFPSFRRCLEATKRSLSNDTSETEFKGVTFQPKGKQLHLLSLDRPTMTHAIVSLDASVEFGSADRVVVATDTVNQLLRITDGQTEPIVMSIDDRRIMARSGGVTLWSRLEEPPNVWREMLNVSIKHRGGVKRYVQVPDKMEAILKRAIIITQSGVDVTRTKLEAADLALKFYSKSGRGEVRDTATLKEKLPALTLNVDPKRVMDGIALGKFVIVDAGIIFASKQDDTFYFVTGN